MGTIQDLFGSLSFSGNADQMRQFLQTNSGNIQALTGDGGNSQPTGLIVWSNQIAASIPDGQVITPTDIDQWLALLIYRALDYTNATSNQSRKFYLQNLGLSIDNGSYIPGTTQTVRSLQVSFYSQSNLNLRPLLSEL